MPSSLQAQDLRPLVVHVVYRFDTGGLENGVVNLINRMTDWRHAVIALTESVAAFRARVEREDVLFFSLHKPPGHGFGSWPALFRILRELRPRVVHTRNLAALEMQAAAWWARIPLRVHSEHGRDVEDMDGTARRYQLIRRAYGQFVSHWIALSRDLELYLRERVGVPSDRISQIYNGVDHIRFHTTDSRTPIADCRFGDSELCLVGTVGRMQAVKAQPHLARAFVDLLGRRPDLKTRVRLLMIGDGPLLSECQGILRGTQFETLAWLPGERSDVAEIMRGLDLFVLPSLAEGISNTILEAMASGLPVVATAVGGNADLVRDGVTGQIVSPGDIGALSGALERWVDDPQARRMAGRLGRQEVERRFSLEAMVQAYRDVYRRAIPPR